MASPVYIETVKTEFVCKEVMLMIGVVEILTLIISVLKFGYELGKDVGKKIDRQSLTQD